MDDLTPMESTFQELPPERPTQTPDHYGTGRSVQAHSHFPVIAVLLAVLFAMNLLTVTVLARLRTAAQSTRNGTALKGNLERLSDTPEQKNNTQTAESSGLALSRNGESLSLGEIYRKLKPSLTVVTADGGRETLSGTGLLLTSDGYLLTNAHTVSDAGQLTVTLSDGTDCAASFVGMDAASDLAVLHIEAQGLTAAEFGDSDLVSAGDAVAAFGNPFGQTLDGTMNEGIICAVNEGVMLGGVQTTIFQTNVRLLGEDAGGVLVNGSGQVIAVGLREVAGFVSYESASEIGFALPTQEVVRVVNDLIRYGNVSGRPTLGIEVAALETPLRVYWGLPEGVIVTDIDRDGNAYREGLRTGDVIVSVDGSAVEDVASYLEAISQHGAGDVLRIVLYRNGQRYYTDVALAAADS